MAPPTPPIVLAADVDEHDDDIPVVTVVSEPDDVELQPHFDALPDLAHRRLAVVLALLSVEGPAFEFTQHRARLERFTDEWAAHPASFGDFATGTRKALTSAIPALVNARRARRGQIAPFALKPKVVLVKIAENESAQALYARLFEPESTNTVGPGWSTMRQRIATAARANRDHRLRTETLRPIKRRCLSERLEDLGARAMRGDATFVAVITAPAGYGKTTAMGQAYDAAVGVGGGWVGAASADELANQADVLDALASALQATSSTWSTFVETAEGPGLVLLDTVDLILTPASARALAAGASTLRGRGISLVLACRDWEYRTLLERMLRDHERVSIGRFSLDEALEAARAFLADAPSLDAERFLQELARLGHESSRVERIIKNPLLLSFVCALYGRSGAVPDDLTVRALYDELVHRKVHGSRRDRDVVDRERARRREECCLDFARLSYERSVNALQEFLLRAEFVPRDSESAFADLRSEGIFETDKTDVRAWFFHQTFLEYWIGLWLSTDPRRGFELIDRINSINGVPPLFLGHLLRAYLSMLPPEHYADAVARLRVPKGVEDVISYRALAGAWAERAFDHELGARLLAAAGREPVLQDALVDALVTLGAPTVAAIGSFALKLSDTLEMNPLRRAVPFLADVALATSDEQFLQLADQLSKRSRPNAHLLSIFCVDLGDRDSRAADERLILLDPRYHEMGPKARSALLRAFARTASPEQRARFFGARREEPLPHDMHEPATALCRGVFEDTLAATTDAWPTAIELLDRAPRPWYEPTAFGIGAWAASSSSARTRTPGASSGTATRPSS